MRNQSYHRGFEPSEFYDGFPSYLGENNMQMTQFGVLCWSAALIVTMSLPAVAQQPGAPGGGQGRGQGRGGGQRGGFGGRGGGQLTLANVPVEALAKSLGLSADQKTKIEAIQTKHR